MTSRLSHSPKNRLSMSAAVKCSSTHRQGARAQRSCNNHPSPHPPPPPPPHHPLTPKNLPPPLAISPLHPITISPPPSPSLTPSHPRISLLHSLSPPSHPHTCNDLTSSPPTSQLHLTPSPRCQESPPPRYLTCPHPSPSLQESHLLPSHISAILPPPPPHPPPPHSPSYCSPAYACPTPPCPSPPILTLFPHEGQRPREDVHEVGQPVRVLHCVELADVHHVVLVLQHGSCSKEGGREGEVTSSRPLLEYVAKIVFAHFS